MTVNSWRNRRLVKGRSLQYIKKLKVSITRKYFKKMISELLTLINADNHVE